MFAIIVTFNSGAMSKLKRESSTPLVEFLALKQESRILGHSPCVWFLHDGTG